MAQDFVKPLSNSFLRDGYSLHSDEEILSWIEQANASIYTKLRRIGLNECQPWFYDKAEDIIRNEKRSFFSISGIRQGQIEQPIIIQNEIGYLGFLCKEINGTLHFLMQAKIEPGNINKVQISPTIQATESNFKQKHGGKKPKFLEYFAPDGSCIKLTDINQPEQCARFLGKFNRNVAVMAPEIEETPGFKFMTASQIQRIAIGHHDLVNMDTRTIISSLPRDMAGGDYSEQAALWLKRRIKESGIQQPVKVGLMDLKDWQLDENGIHCRRCYPFSIEFFDIEIQGREVTHWTQPLAVAEGKAEFGLLMAEKNRERFFLIKFKPEIGCANVALFGPTVQQECYDLNPDGRFDEIFEKNTIISTILSEEGGRFYREENINKVAAVDFAELENAAKNNDDCLLVNEKTLLSLIRKHRLCNIQLRNLYALI